MSLKAFHVQPPSNIAKPNIGRCSVRVNTSNQLKEHDFFNAMSQTLEQKKRMSYLFPEYSSDCSAPLGKKYSAGIRIAKPKAQSALSPNAFVVHRLLRNQNHLARIFGKHNSAVTRTNQLGSASRHLTGSPTYSRTCSSRWTRHDSLQLNLSERLLDRTPVCIYASKLTSCNKI